ncbi:hypothetical protein O6H91_06G054000 [Diphasiastrum complanatum]|uniref:Uncharacterized protein n=1 Tax=Diphasiastrum complanatum TaxID=34168 RepID=A0ACC2DDS6_DIPCM|nr:hypothetical protein O6H91_06G054000 [Diphasiastrum complanatum]
MPAIRPEPLMHHLNVGVCNGKLNAPLPSPNGSISKSTQKLVCFSDNKKIFRNSTVPYFDTGSICLSSRATSFFSPLYKISTILASSSSDSSSQRTTGDVISSVLNIDVPTTGDKFNPLEAPRLEGNGAVKTEEPAAASHTASDLEDEKEKPRSVLDYMKQVPEFLKPDNGPPRWFCPLEAGSPPRNAPSLFFLPGLDSTGLGLILHQKNLGRMFEVRCLHIPVMDRTPFEGLLKIVEETIRVEHKNKPSKPLYIVGDSFGGMLALALAARNPNIDLVLILANPATSFERSQLQPIFPLLNLLPNSFMSSFPYALSFTMGDPIRMASAKIKNNSSPLDRAQKVSDALVELLPTLPILAQVIPKETLLWKLKILHSGALYTNSRLHAVRAQVLLLVSGKDQLLPSMEEGKRLKKLLQNCIVRIFKDSGHTLLLEAGLNLATLIKSNNLYRQSKVYDIVSDYIFPTQEEFELVCENLRIYREITSPVFFSTHQNGLVQQGLSAIPREQPLLLVGNHMLMGLEISLIPIQFLRERNQLIRGIAHPYLFQPRFGEQISDTGFNDLLGLFGAVPVSGKNLFKVLSRKQSALLYPGGAREALHMKGEEYKLFWPKDPEFVRMAARHGATILPFSAVGEDDIVELIADYNDLQRNPILRSALILDVQSIRPDSDGEVSKQPFYMPILGPKIPGRLYILFGRPFHTAGREKEFLDKENAQSAYLQVKGEVEAGLQYLIEKRNFDPYRNMVPRLVYEASWGWTRQAPTFEP